MIGSFGAAKGRAIRESWDEAHKVKGGFEDPDVSAHEFLQILTAEGSSLNWWQMSARSALVYIIALLIVRAGKKRLFGRNAALDVVVGVILGSVMSRAINGAGELLSTSAGAAVLVLLHSLSAKIAVHFPSFSRFVKGNPRLLVKDGKWIQDRMVYSAIGKEDVEESARDHGKFLNVDQIAEARLERDGSISIVQKEKPPRVLEVRVEDGVQTVRIEVG